MLVHHPSPGEVDQEGAVFHLVEHTFIDHVERAGLFRHMNAQEVGFGHHFLKIGEPDMVMRHLIFRPGRGEVIHAANRIHLPYHAHPAHPGADIAAADDPQSLAVEQVAGHFRFGPAAPAQQAVGMYDVAGQADHHPEGHFRNRLGARLGHPD